MLHMNYNIIVRRRSSVYALHTGRVTVHQGEVAWMEENCGRKCLTA